MKRLGFATALVLATRSAFAHDTPPDDDDVVAIVEKPPPPPKPRPITLGFEGGYDIRSLEALPVHGAELGLTLVAEPWRHFAIGGSGSMFIGSTPAGLDVKAGRTACSFDLVLDRLRLFVDPGVFLVGIGRITYAQTIIAGGPTVAAGARFDVMREDTFALFLRAAADAGVTFGDGSFYGGVTFGAGLDWDFVRGDRRYLP